MAKLVEILARELKEWPGVRTISQGAKCFLRDEANYPMEMQLELASDWSTAIVTRAEWQAAVDALKAKDIASSTAAMIDAGWIDPRPPVSPSLHAQVVGRANRIPEWDGVGLPPVGTVCERRTHAEAEGGRYEQVRIIAHTSKGFPVWENTDAMFAGISKTQRMGDHPEFRPIRTPEQIAADDREEEVNRMVATAPMLDKGWARKVCYALYDNNYRKQEPK